ncbi:MAG: threonylcarbamoyl-AMP synthase [Clostridiales bacterium 38-18]|nr:MAG: threonylcarbamoyl-AMP synthase [Clostridiales bacterium 38-18]
MMRKTKIIHVNSEMSNETLVDRLTEAAQCLSNGGTVAFPTETVYGLGANALSDNAVNAIYEAKGRPSDNPLIVHIASMEMLSELVVEVRPYVEKLMAAFWPGPITFVMKKKAQIPLKVTGGLSTVGIRMPANVIALELIRLSGKPIAAPSANLSGKPSPTQAKTVIEDLEGRVDYIIAGDSAEVGLESTVLDVTGEAPIILRPGKVTCEMIKEVVGACSFDAAITKDKIETDGVAKAPGMKYRHYAPNAPVQVYMGNPTEMVKCFFEAVISCSQKGTEKVGILTFEEEAMVLERMIALEGISSDNYYIISAGSAKDLTAYAKILFESLRTFDAALCTYIIARGVEEVGLGEAIMNRLKKAAEGKVTRI